MMTSGRGRKTFPFCDDPLAIDDVGQNPPTAVPITRSLSKVCLRDLTQKPPPPPRAQVIDRAEDDISVQPSTQATGPSVEPNEEPMLLPRELSSRRPCSFIEQLPAEILDTVISHLAGQLGLNVARHSIRSHDWGDILRHPRRKDITNLALVSPTWRQLIQERIFRHIKIQGTQPALTEMGDFFLSHPHLQGYVRHLQVIVPLWETAAAEGIVPGYGSVLMSRGQDGIVLRFNHPQSSTHGIIMDHQAEHQQMFRPATKKASLAEIFAYAQALVPQLHALTIESANCKHPPQISFFRPGGRGVVPSQPLENRIKIASPVGPTLPTLPSVKALILQGAWNIIRNPKELELISNAIPNLNDIKCTYHTLKTSPYITMCDALHPRRLPLAIRHINLCLESSFSKTPDSLAKWKKVYPTYHICRTLGDTFPQLESLSYTGRLCGSLFSEAVRAAQNQQYEHICTKKIDIVVRNVCRDPKATNDATGIQSWQFILAFEHLIKQAMRALAFYPRLDTLRIRFIDLDSPDQALNPSFHLERNLAWGFWSEQIAELFYAARPMGTLILPPLEEDTLHLASRPTSKQSISIERYRLLSSYYSNRF